MRRLWRPGWRLTSPPLPGRPRPSRRWRHLRLWQRLWRQWRRQRRSWPVPAHPDTLFRQPAVSAAAVLLGVQIVPHVCHVARQPQLGGPCQRYRPESGRRDTQPGSHRPPLGHRLTPAQSVHHCGVWGRQRRPAQRTCPGRPPAREPLRHRLLRDQRQTSDPRRSRPTSPRAPDRRDPRRWVRQGWCSKLQLPQPVGDTGTRQAQ